MPDQVVRLADHVRLGVGRDPKEHLVRIGDDPFRVGLGHDDLVRAEQSLTPSWLNTGLPHSGFLSRIDLEPP